jgi:cystathionine gamma-lyase
MGFETDAVHAGEEPNLKEGGTGDVTAPIHLSTTFARKKTDTPTGGYAYSRTDNPTRHALEVRLAALEKARFGIAFSTGLAAETSVMLALLKSGDHVVAFDDLYGGTKRLMDKIFADKFDISVDYVDATDTKNVERAMKENTKLVWLESPTNPLMKLCDIKAISQIAKKKNAIVVVDNTFATPYLQKPLVLGADIALYSTTKYINGHSDSMGGAVILSDEELYTKVKFLQNSAGAILSPFDSFLIMRGLETLALRMDRHDKNAIQVAEFLESHDAIKSVRYPGLKSHPQHELAKRQMSGFTGMMAIELEGNMKTAKKFLEALKIFSLAEDLGSVKSLAEHPASMTHASVSKEFREKVGITDTLLRLSVGIEDINDIISDLENALKVASR